MATTNDKLGRPTLESSDQPFALKHTVSSTLPTSLFPKLRADRSASLPDAMEMIDILIEKYEAQYIPNAKDSNLLLMPNLFLEPTQGTEIRNLSTDEIYTITDTIKNPTTGQWEGLVRISANCAPNADLQEKLEFVTDDRLIRFAPEYSQFLGVEGQTDDELISDAGPIRPTIVYGLIKKEPGSIGKQIFGPQKQVKPSHRENLKHADFAGRTVEVEGQWFDCLVEFACFTTDNRSADQLADWFERFMRQNTWVLKLNGVQELVYFQRLRDVAVTKWRQDLISRAVQYAFRIEEILPVVRRDFRNFETAVNLASRVHEEGKRWIAGREITGPLTPNEYRDLFRDSDGKYLFGEFSLNDGNLT